MPEQGEPLTEREKEILQMVATGATNRQIAYRLSISTNTVKVHLRNIFSKVGAESRTEATMIAVREGWVSIEAARTGSLSTEDTALPMRTGTSVAQPQPLTVAPEPPLPWFKRVALVAAVLLTAAGIALTWPRTSQRANAKPNPPFDRLSDQPVAALVGSAGPRWRELAPMPTRRAHLALAVADGWILAIGGRTPEGVTAVMEAYDPARDTWVPRRAKPTPVAYAAAAAIGAHVYVPGGCDAEGTPTQAVEVYDALSDSWDKVRPLPEPRCAYALGLLDGRIYVFGGWDGEQYVATTYIYDPQADAWTEGPAMEPKRGFAAAASLEGHLYVVGGYDGDRELTTCTVYDPAANTIRECAPLAVGRGGLGLVALNDMLYSIGGGGWTSYLGFNERYNPADDTWSVIETPVVGEWRSPGVVAFETSIYAIGGLSSDYMSLNQAYEPLSFRTFIPITNQ